MDAKLWFWTGALATLVAIVVCGVRGVRAIRAGDVARHRRAMVAAAVLVGLFLASYLVKVQVLGAEDRSTWSGLDRAILYVHELCVAVMLGAGAFALYRAWRFRRALGEPPRLPSDPSALPGRVAHRRAGRIAVRAGLLALVTAIGVWIGMLLRA